MLFKGKCRDEPGVISEPKQKLFYTLPFAQGHGQPGVQGEKSGVGEAGGSYC